MSFIDDFSKFTWIYLLKSKADVLQVFLQFQKYVECLLNKQILYMQNNWGGAYKKLHAFFNQADISHRVSCPYTHQQNGSAEIKHRHIVEVGLALLSQASMPIKFWDEAFQNACFLINRLPSKVINNLSPLERLLGSKPNYSFLQIFGCACWPNLRPYNTHKLQFKSQECVFIGYRNLHKWYKYLNKTTGRIYISSDVIFDEQIFPFSRDSSKLSSKSHCPATSIILPSISLHSPPLASSISFSHESDQLEDIGSKPPLHTNLNLEDNS